MQEDLSSGNLIQPFPTTVDVGAAYWLNYPSERELPNKAKLFRTWLKQEVAALDWTRWRKGIAPAQ